MKNKIIKFVIYMLPALVLVSSCTDEWLETRPKDLIIQEEMWMTREQLEMAVAGCYIGMIENTIPGDGGNKDKITSSVVYKMIMWGELRADNVVTVPAGAREDERKMKEFNISPGNLLCEWGEFYNVINKCNVVWDNADEVLKHDETISQYEVDAYKAEVLAIRALMYFYLVRTYKEVPLVVQSSKTNKQDYFVPKETEDKVINQIITDLNWAYNHAIVSYDDVAYDKGRFNKTSIAALQADVYLWAKQYDNCLKACETVLSDKKIMFLAFDEFSASMAGYYWWSLIFMSGNSNESIFELQYGKSTDLRVYVNDGLFKAYGSSDSKDNPQLTVNSENFTTPTSKVFDAYDFRAENSSIALIPTLTVVGYSLVNKFPRVKTTQRANWIVYRLPEIYFIKAEALLETNFEANKAEALTLINKTYKRAHPVLIPGGVQDSILLSDFSTKEAAMNKILDEKRKEFLFEGKRWFDLLRYSRKEPNPMRVFTEYVGISGNIPAEYSEMAIQKLRSEYARYLPIPFDDIENNPNLEQNPFYKNMMSVK